MKSGRQLQRDVTAELARDPGIRHADISVAVSYGIVTLSGLVRSYVEKTEAERAVQRVAGTRAIAEALKVRYPWDAKTADAEIARRILDLFAWNASVPGQLIDVKVERGLVTLSGTVERVYQKEAVGRVAGRVSGVTGVSNLIALRQVPVAGDVKERIVAAIKRAANGDAQSVTVVTDAGKVTLGGRLRGWSERGIAERATWAAPGVTSIEDNIITI